MRQYGHQKPQQPATGKEMPHISSHPQIPFILIIPHTYKHPTLTDAHVLTAVTHSAAPLGHVSAHHHRWLDTYSLMCHHELT